MIILPRNIRVFPFFFLAISTTDKPVNRSIKAYSLTKLNVFALRGFIFRDIHKNKEGVRAIRVMKYKKYVAGKSTRARAPLARKFTNRIFESKDGKKSIKIVNYIERHNFCWNDLPTKSNRTEIQTYKVEERTFGTPIKDNFFFAVFLAVAVLVFFFFGNREILPPW